MNSFQLSTILICLVASTAAAEVVIDQEHVAPPASYYFDYVGDYMAQSFTLRNTGRITSVGLQISRSGSTLDPLHLQLTRTNSAGEPLLADVLATYDINPALVNSDYTGLPMVNIDLSSRNVQVQAGDVLALVLSSNYIRYNWNESITFDEIAGGKFFVYSPKTFGARWFYQWSLIDPTRSGDAGYRITIDTVPEPSSLILASLALFAFISPRFRYRKSGLAALRVESLGSRAEGQK